MLKAMTNAITNGYYKCECQYEWQMQLPITMTKLMANSYDKCKCQYVW